MIAVRVNGFTRYRPVNRRIALGTLAALPDQAVDETDVPWRPAPDENLAAPACVSPLSIVARPRTASLRIASSSVRSHCSMADRRSLRMQICGSVGQLVGQGDGRRQGLTRRDDAVDEAHPLRLDPVDATPRQDQVAGPAVPDQARQADRPEVDERHAEAPAVHAEHGIRGSDPQVAPQGELEPAGNCGTLDRGDDGLGEAEPASAPSVPDRLRPPDDGPLRPVP